MSSSVPKKKMEIVQGATFRKTIYWYNGTDVVLPITAVARGYPTICTAVSHGLPVTSAVPATLLGSVDWLTTPSTRVGQRIYVYGLSADTFKVFIDSTQEAAYTGGNYLQYTPPVDLSAGWTARMQLRESVDSTTFLWEMTTENGGISLGADGAVNLTILPINTADFDFTTAVGQPELISPTGEVTRLASIQFSLNKESTR